MFYFAEVKESFLVVEMRVFSFTENTFQTLIENARIPKEKPLFFKTRTS